MEVKYRCLELFLHRIVGRESGAAIKQALKDWMVKEFDISFESFIENLTFATDCARNMPPIVGSSVSESPCPYNERWVGWVSHKLNKCMKHVMEKQKREGLVVWEDLERVKVIVRVFKHGSWNDEMR